MDYIIPFRYNKDNKTSLSRKIVTHDKLKASEKIFLIYLCDILNISYLKKNKMYCILTKKYLSEQLKMSKRTFDTIFKNLKKENVILIKTENKNKNKIYLLNPELWYRKICDTKIVKFVAV